jgi:hypothetical protein
VAPLSAAPAPEFIQTANTEAPAVHARTLPARPVKLLVGVLSVRSRRTFAPQLPGSRHQFFTLL